MSKFLKNKLNFNLHNYFIQHSLHYYKTKILSIEKDLHSLHLSLYKGTFF